MSIENLKFSPNTTASRCDLSKVQVESFTHKLIEKLNISTKWDNPIPLNSIMGYGVLCDCDDSFLCEHRLQHIIDYCTTYEREMKIKFLKKISQHNH